VAEEYTPTAATVVSVEVMQTLQWCLRYFTRRDEADAATLLVVVHYSPLTHAVAESLHSLMAYQPEYYWPPGTEDKVHQVLSSVDDSPRSPSML
jgi:hypothetical protein